MRSAELEPGVYMSGCRIHEATAVHLPESAVGRVLTRHEALGLLIPKRTSAPTLIPRPHD